MQQSNLKPFDPLHTPLEGVNLIEASAGTGKTYAIEGLFVRLLLEKKLSLDQILVVTFTKAATEELKDRIRRKLIQAQRAFSGYTSSDPLFAGLLATCHDRPSAADRIQNALINFDEAAIFTIHGFCQRVLVENAFETGCLFDTQLVADQTDLLREVADDFWRKHLYTAPAEWVNYVLGQIAGPEAFMHLFEKVKAPGIRIIPEIRKPDLGHLDTYRKSFAGLRAAWSGARDEVAARLKEPVLSATVYGSLKPDTWDPNLSKRDQKVLALVEAMDRFLDAKSIGFPLCDAFEKFTATKIGASLKKNQKPICHHFFSACEKHRQIAAQLQAEFENYLIYTKKCFIEYARTQLASRKKQANILFFDDLLTLLAHALESSTQDALVHAIRQKYRAALVDEFQDTDDIQYRIFSSLFGNKDSALFMIGDPKQAIYSFRGADIFSYLQAAHDADARYTLTENWRSDPALIAAVNALFSHIDMPFIFDEISFAEAKPGLKPSTDEGCSSPLTLWYLASETGQPIAKTTAVERIAAAVAGEIARLIRADTAVRGPGEIAVLVRTNRQAQIVKAHLNAKRIPSVLHGAGNLFDSFEAMELERILTGICEPGNESRLKAALTTDMLGVSANELDKAGEKPDWWENYHSRFSAYHKMWSSSGFIRMFRLLMATEKARGRLLSFPDGERRLTNVLHLAEILHQRCVEQKPGMAGLIKWFAEQRDPASPRLEAHQLRLESDAQAVTIVTIHKSKGLQYPVVFCPFAWQGASSRRGPVMFHDPGPGHPLTLDLESEGNSAHTHLAQKEQLAENLRLLYVAVTRAQKRCYLIWGRIRTAETSAMAYLLHPKLAGSADNIQACLQQQMLAAKTDQDLLDDLNHLVQRSKGTVTLGKLPMADHGEVESGSYPEEVLRPRQFRGKIDSTWKISSYSALVTRQAFDREFPDRDALVPEPDRRIGLPEPMALPGAALRLREPDIFSFPKGSRAGTFFHDVFEHFDFAAPDPAHVQVLVESRLKQYGFDSTWQETVCRMLDKVVRTPLKAKPRGLCLSEVRLKNRINESEFYFPLKPITPEKLRAVFASHDRIPTLAGFPDRLERLVFSPVGGFMKGYIDMIFRRGQRYYIVDWKSNFLGPGMADYHKDRLKQAMLEGFYLLQYHLYILALDQYLRLRQPDYTYERHFGGIFYLFIRGIDPNYGPDYGIYRDLPPRALIEALGRALISEFRT